MAARVSHLAPLTSLWSNSLQCLHLSTFLTQIKFLKRPICSSTDYNPLFDQDALPRFKLVKTKHVVPGVRRLAANFERDFNELEDKLKNPRAGELSWKTVVEPMELFSPRLDYGWGIVMHMNEVRNSEALRRAHQEVLPLVVQLSTKVAQSLPLYSAMEKLKSDDSTLDEGQKRIITSFLRAARNGGVALTGNKKQKFNEIVLKLAELTTKFGNNVLDSKKQFSFLITEPGDVAGMPDSLLQLTASAAAQENTALSNNRSKVDPKKGPWKLTLDTPCLMPFLKYSDKRELREKMYRANIAVASAGKVNNSQIIEDIRQLRLEKSTLLGFEDYAALSLESKMAGTANEVWTLIQQLKDKSRATAKNDLQNLKVFARDNGFQDKLQLWDLPYWSEKQRQHLFSFSDEELRPYFPLPRVLDGLFKLTSELFGVTIKPADGATEVWHDDVRFFNIYNEDGEHVASFYLDPYSRPADKQGGAWMNSCVDKSSLLKRRPVAYLVCNQTPPGADGSPSLMTFREVETLFHEFGHGLQHMLTTVPYSDAAGIKNIEWDAVELPSQFMENWLYDRTTVEMVSGHYQTGEPLPDKIFQQICKARQFLAGTQMLRQLYFAALDMELYTSSDPWPVVRERIAGDYTVMKPLKDDCFPCSFLHIFSHGYAAGYYSYKWAEVMSADAFGAFKEVGLENRSALAEVGRRFRDTVLASGGARHPRDVFQSFRGRAPSADALLETYGLI